jgi:hypothetical protein
MGKMGEEFLGDLLSPMPPSSHAPHPIYLSIFLPLRLVFRTGFAWSRGIDSTQQKRGMSIKPTSGSFIGFSRNETHPLLVGFLLAFDSGIRLQAHALVQSM